MATSAGRTWGAEVTARSGAGGISAVLDHVLETDPDRLALVAFDRRLTYGELDDQANAAAVALRDLGVRPGDRVAACLPNGTDIVVAFLASMRLGSLWVGINQLLAPPEKAGLLSAASPTVLLADGPTAATLEGLCPPDTDLVLVDPFDPDSAWRALVHRGAGARRGPSPDPSQPAAIAYTSGTTGLPRGVVHSQDNLLLPGEMLVASRRYGPDLRKGDFLPFTILNLAALSVLTTTQAGGCCVLFDRRDADGIAHWLSSEAVTVWNAVPALLHSFVARPDTYEPHLGSLREVWTGGADCPEHLRQGFVDRFGIPVFATYGLTEAPSIVTIDPIDGPHVEGASGIALPHMDLFTRDAEGARLPAGTEGEITVAATSDGAWAGRYRPMLGFWDTPADDAGAHGSDAVPPNWLCTDDLGWVDDNGYLFVRGRKKVLIVRGGANVYPAEVERVLLAAEGVRGCSVLGIPDERLGERVAAVVELEPGARFIESALREFCSANLAKYKVPERIVVVEHLPRNSMGKVQGGQLLELFDTRGDDVDSPQCQDTAREGVARG